MVEYHFQQNFFKWPFLEGMLKWKNTFLSIFMYQLAKIILIMFVIYFIHLLKYLYT